MKNGKRNETKIYGETELNREEIPRTDQVLSRVYQQLMRQGYDPVEQLLGYLLSGDPAYITESGGARRAVGKIDRDELLAELVGFYMSQYKR